MEEYYKNGILLRDDGPVSIIYYYNGNIHTEEYRISNGLNKISRLHRVDGPAYIQYNEDGSLMTAQYWVEGIRYEDIFKWTIAIGTLELKVI